MRFTIWRGTHETTGRKHIDHMLDNSCRSLKALSKVYLSPDRAERTKQSTLVRKMLSLASMPRWKACWNPKEYMTSRE